MERSSGPEKVDCGASQEVDRSKFPPEARVCLDLLDQYFNNEITVEALNEGLRRMKRDLKRKQPWLI